MKKKNKINNSMLWWLDTSILNTSLIFFKYSHSSTIFTIKLNQILPFFYINKKNLNCLYFYLLDMTIINNYKFNMYYIAFQSIFFDYQILIESKIKSNFNSLSSIYSGASWIERELKESNTILYTNLNDSRKLLLNYNLNDSIQYNNYNNIINDLLI